ncbi:hypothetical protein BDV96DRAFT_603179 [Lophiotrema nucula]|uniref:Uncharacterized protein n=1 Tax=Lophiotrema nucula TaxID=690887 RepID=A0A6A5YZN8_9PLEO|nr:hypothetical protein BDV96DRAFT_603179 [Lophiotrema nucula]
MASQTPHPLLAKILEPVEEAVKKIQARIAEYSDDLASFADESTGTANTTTPGEPRTIASLRKIIDLHKDFLYDLAQARLEFVTWIIKMGFERSKPKSEQNATWIKDWQREKQMLNFQLGMCQIFLMRDCEDIMVKGPDAELRKDNGSDRMKRELERDLKKIFSKGKAKSGRV